MPTSCSSSNEVTGGASSTVPHHATPLVEGTSTTLATHPVEGTGTPATPPVEGTSPSIVAPSVVTLPMLQTFVTGPKKGTTPMSVTVAIIKAAALPAGMKVTSPKATTPLVGVASTSGTPLVGVASTSPNAGTSAADVAMVSCL